MDFKKLVESVLVSEVALSSANKIRFMKQFNTDSAKALEYLERFNSAVLKLSNKDIFSYKSLEELDRALEGIKGVKTKREAKRESALQGSKIIYEDDDYVLRLIRSKKAAIAYGKGATWCISYDDSKKNDDEPGTGNMFWTYALKHNFTIYIAQAKRRPSDIASDNGKEQSEQLSKDCDDELKKIAILIDERGYCEIWSAINEKEYEGSQTIAHRRYTERASVMDVYPNALSTVKYIPYTDKELLQYMDESIDIGIKYALSTETRVPNVEEYLLKHCDPTEYIGNRIVDYSTKVVGQRWPEYEVKLLERLRYIIDRKSYYARIFEHYNSDRPFIEYMKILQNTNEVWPEFEELLESFSGDRGYRRMYYTYKNMAQGREMNSQDSSFYYEDRGI